MDVNIGFSGSGCEQGVHRLLAASRDLEQTVTSASRI